MALNDLSPTFLGSGAHLKKLHLAGFPSTGGEKPEKISWGNGGKILLAWLCKMHLVGGDNFYLWCFPDSLWIPLKKRLWSTSTRPSFAVQDILHQEWKLLEHKKKKTWVFLKKPCYSHKGDSVNQLLTAGFGCPCKIFPCRHMWAEAESPERPTRRRRRKKEQGMLAIISCCACNYFILKIGRTPVALIFSFSQERKWAVHCVQCTY